MAGARMKVADEPASPAEQARGSIDAAIARLTAAGVLTPQDEVVAAGAGVRRSSGGDVYGVEQVAHASLFRNEYGALLWHDGAAGLALPGRRARRGADPLPGGEWVQTVPFERLEKNKVTEFVARIDTELNDRRGLHRIVNGKVADPVVAVAGKKKRLLLIHGTFSKTEAFLDGMAQCPDGAGGQFWQWAHGAYDEILCFDHPTLSVGSLLNAVDLSRFFREASGELDIIAHSRGGLVARWLLDVLGAGGCAPCRAVLVGAPLAGTGLASPPRLRSTLSALTSIGNAMRAVGEAASVFQPWIAGPTALMRIAASFTGALAHTPVIDATVALIPGLFAQSRVGNNPEIERLRLSEPVSPPRYFAVTSNFETEKAGWQFWRWFRRDKILDAAADAIFDAANDLVVDTSSMDDLGPDASRASVICDFGTNDTVYHTNYFRQKATLAALQATLV